MLKKSIALVVAAALVATAPGLGTYEVLANNFAAGAAKGVSVVPGGTSAAGVGGINKAGFSGHSLNSSINMDFSGGLPSVESVIHTGRVNAVAVGQNAVMRMPTGGGNEGEGLEDGLLKHKQPGTPAAMIKGPTGGGNQGDKKGGEQTSRPTKGIPAWVKQGNLNLKGVDVAEMSAAQARSFGARMMDQLLGRKTGRYAELSAAPVAGVIGNVRSRMPGLKPVALSRASSSDAVATDAVPAAEIAANGGSAPQGRGRIFGFVKTVAVMAAAAGAVFGVHAAAAALLPAVFGTVPIAAVWAVSTGVFILPVALYSRYRLSLRDSARLGKVKIFADLAIGAFIGASAIAAPVLFTGAVMQSIAVSLPAVLGLTYAATASNQNTDGMVGGIINSILTWMSLNLIAPLFGTAVGALPITLGSVFGLMAIPAMVTFSFFLGRIIRSAESGRQFSVPGSQQKIRFPSYTWVMTGVVFALLTGYNPVWTNAAFGAWMLLGSKKWFNYVYFALLGWSAITGFAAPVTFLAIAFLPERASMWTENLLEKLLPEGKAAPSTAKEQTIDPYMDKPESWPRFRYWLKTGIVMASLVGAGVVLSATVFGFGKFFVNLGIAGALSLVPLIFSKWLIKKTMRAEPMSEEDDPEVFGIMRELREKINEERTAKGKKPIPMPEMVNVPMQVPNAFATGFSPMSAMVGVTYEMKDMTLNPRRAKEGLIRLLYSVDPQSKSYRVFRRAIRGSIPGIAEDAGPQEVIQALQDAEASQIKALGVRALRGVMGHEFSHVMHRDMLLGAITGAVASAISFASYGVLWAAGHAEAMLQGLWDKITGKKAKADQRARKGKPPVRMPEMSVDAQSAPEAQPGPVRPEVVDPVTTAAGVGILLGLAKIFAALWAPIMARVLQMASGRTREGHADEAGAELTEDPESLALGLGLLTSWRPASMFTFERALLPRLAAMANVMTVNPLQQLREAGALPGATPKSVKGMPVTQQDDWFFNLFITHPDTTQRIERLDAMAEALAAQQKSDAAAADESGAPSSRSDGSLRAASSLGESSSVDPNSTEALAKPGLDVRLMPLAQVLQDEITSSQEKFNKLGHLLWTLDELLKRGGVVRYAYTFDPETQESLPGFFNPSEKALYINDTIMRAEPRLQGSILAGLLQQAYDHLNSRAAGTQESAVRQILARDSFLDGADMADIAKSVDIGNVVSVELFESVLQNRLWAASGMSALERIFGESVSINHLIQRGKDHVSLLKRELRDLEDQMQLFEDGLRKDKGNEGYDRQVRVLREKIGIKKGNIRVAQTQLKMAETERGAAESLLTPLSVDKAHRARFDTNKLGVVGVKARPKVDPKLQTVLNIIGETIRTSKDPAIRGLAYIEETVEKLLESGGHIQFAAPGDGAAAYFSPVTLDVVIGREFAQTHPALIAALMVHELTHAADYFGVPSRKGEPWLQRPLTRETERNAFTNEAIFIGAFDPEEVASRLDVNNPMEHAAYQLVFHARMKYVEGKTSLEAMISDAYRDLFGAHFSGLQTAQQFKAEIANSKLAKIVEAYEDLRQRAELTQRAVENGQETRRVQLLQMLKALSLYEAYITVYQRQMAQMDLEAAEAGPEEFSADSRTADPARWSLFGLRRKADRAS
ncbi:MAG: M48 family metalloprotease [Elusimicrobiota bacterium]